MVSFLNCLKYDLLQNTCTFIKFIYARFMPKRRMDMMCKVVIKEVSSSIFVIFV